MFRYGFTDSYMTTYIRGKANYCTTMC